MNLTTFRRISEFDISVRRPCNVSAEKANVNLCAIVQVCNTQCICATHINKSSYKLWSGKKLNLTQQKACIQQSKEM